MVSRAVMRLSVSYPKAINKRYDHVGPLFQGLFRAKHINQDTCLWRVIDYIHQDPVKGEMIHRLEDWEHSNCRMYHDLKDAGYLRKDLLSSNFRLPGFLKPSASVADGFARPFGFPQACSVIQNPLPDPQIFRGDF